MNIEIKSVNKDNISNTVVDFTREEPFTYHNEVTINQLQSKIYDIENQIFQLQQAKEDLQKKIKYIYSALNVTDVAVEEKGGQVYSLDAIELSDSTEITNKVAPVVNEISGVAEEIKNP
jgi:hypothetical protein